MFWQENIKEGEFTIPTNVMDLSFQISSKILPIDHHFLLKKAICQHLSCEQKNLAIFGIGVADGNGWKQDKNGFFYPSKRSKLTLRIKKENMHQALNLVGQTLKLDNYQIKIKQVLTPKKLSDSDILFSKMIVCEIDTVEDDFLQNIFSTLQKLKITPKKMMAGLTRKIKIANRTIGTRSLMIAELKKSESVIIQENGIGAYQLLGCGIFVPQKNITSVNAV